MQQAIEQAEEEASLEMFEAQNAHWHFVVPLDLHGQLLDHALKFLKLKLETCLRAEVPCAPPAFCKPLIAGVTRTCEQDERVLGLAPGWAAGPVWIRCWD